MYVKWGTGIIWQLQLISSSIDIEFFQINLLFASPILGEKCELTFVCIFSLCL
jgi:hypothetical protein